MVPDPVHTVELSTWSCCTHLGQMVEKDLEMGRLMCWADKGRASDSIQRFHDFFVAKHFIIAQRPIFKDPDSIGGLSALLGGLKAMPLFL